MVSAQSFMVTVDLNTDDFTDTDYITNSIGFGYAVNDAFVVGDKDIISLNVLNPSKVNSNFSSKM